MRLPCVLTLASLVCLPLDLAAQAVLARDVRTAPNAFAGLEPAFLAGHGTTAYFAGRSDAHGVELWKSDGTPGGTVLVKDIWPGAEVLGKETIGSSLPTDLQSAGGLVYFVASDGNAGREVWRSDGTAPGTFMLKDIAPGAVDAIGPFAGEFRVYTLGGVLLFAADDVVHGRELWRTDGTSAGTAMVVDLCPGACSGLGWGTAAVFSGHLYFPGVDPNYNSKLWRTDGTAAGTTLVADVAVGYSSLTAAGTTLYFAAYDQAHGTELWATDGTGAGTRLVKDIRPGPESSGPSHMTAVGDSIFFRGDEAASGLEIWTSDGTPAGTRLVADLNLGPAGSWPSWAATLGQKACFAADNGLTGRDVWCTDGTTTTRLVDAGNVDHNLLVHQNRLVFVAGGFTSARLYWSDGTPAGTRPVGSVTPHTPPYEPASVGSRVFLAGLATDLHHNLERELWTSDGTDAGTARVLDAASVSSSPHSLTVLSDRIVFAGDGDGGIEPWASDGTAPGTNALRDFCVGPCSWLQPEHASLGSPFANVPGHVVFMGRDDAAGYELWRTDGTGAGTELLLDANPGPFGSDPDRFVGAGARAFFFAHRSATGRELWTTDGTAGGTALVAELAPGTNGFHATATAVVQDSLFMAGDDRVHGHELFKSDGTAAGTGLVEDLTPGPFGTTLLELTPSGSALYVRAPHPAPVLYRSDGTASGTYAIATAVSDIGQLTDVEGTVFFRARIAGSGAELWKTDGTAAGTVLVRDIVPGPVGSMPSQLVDVDGILYFAASDVAHGVELWRSDGTASGTWMVRDIVPGPAGSVPSALTAVNGRLYFAAFEPGTGAELWTSDGTAAGTQLVQDIAPGGASSSPAKLTMAGSRLFFVANDGTSGREPWSLAGVLPSLAIHEVRQPEGDAGSQPATFAVRVIGEHAAPVTFSFATADGTAVAGSDYQAAAGSLSFAPGSSSSQPIAVSIVGDTAEEPDEDFTLVLGALTGAIAVGGPTRGVVVNDDSPVTVSIEDLETIEGNASTHDALLRVRLSAPRGIPVTVDFTSEDQTAAAPEDYAASAGTVTFAPGATAVPVPVPVHGDRDLEFDETFRVEIANPVNATLADVTGVATIRNDEAPHEPGRALVHGTSAVRDLRTPGVFRIAQKPRSSYEVVVDEVTPDAGFVFLRRLNPFAPGFGEPVGTGNARSLRWMNSTADEVTSQVVEVSSSTCGPCTATDRYRVRAYETTLASPRFSNTGPLRTVVTLQNRGARTVNGQMQFWNAAGSLLNIHPFSLVPRAVLSLDTGALLLVDTESGSITVAHDGRYGDLVGKAATIDTLNGFSFDHAFASRPR